MRIDEHLVEVDGDSHKPLILYIVAKLSVDRSAFLTGHHRTPDQELKRVRYLELVELRQGHLRHRTEDSAGGLREAFSDVDRDEHAGIDVGRHRSPRLSANTSDAPGVTTRSPNTARARASRSGHGETGAEARTGLSRATGRPRRVT